MRQQRGAQQWMNQTRKLKPPWISPRYKHWQHGWLSNARQLCNLRLPQSVHGAPTTPCGMADFAGWKHAKTSAIGKPAQRFAQCVHVCGDGWLANNFHAERSLRNNWNLTQEFIGDEFHIASNRINQCGNHLSVRRAHWVIGHHKQRASFRNAFAVLRGTIRVNARGAVQCVKQFSIPNNLVRLLNHILNAINARDNPNDGPKKICDFCARWSDSKWFYFFCHLNCADCHARNGARVFCNY